MTFSVTDDQGRPHQVLTGTFTATGQGASFQPEPGRPFNLEIRGTFVGTVQLERSLDGTNFVPVTAAGVTLYSWTAPGSESNEESEIGVLFRLNCTAYTSGTINWRISQ